ncbi:MAG: Hsp20/alpha crystallin family protein [Desulfobacterium sp.]|nr:Hsp20/alpha crystallin family protein [Desulfobacterium sp.]
MFGNWKDIDRMFGTLDLLNSRMDRVMNEFNKTLGYDPNWTVTDSVPRTNLYDKGEHFEILAEVPGFSKEDLNVKIQGNYLEVSGTRKIDAPEGYCCLRTERGTTTFLRSFTLPSDVDSARVEAMVENGFLTMRLPKTEASKPKQITIS